MRFSLRAPVLLSWSDSGEMRRAGGFTRDICTRATYVISERESCLLVGQKVTVNILLPPLEHGAQFLHFCGEGHVLRQGEGHEEPGFAVVVELGMGEPRVNC